ncbi:hypothetical protein ONS95_008629 [Cadophora gregata]|uniref:uncharacterized protein n=1 Tax=Cadophora gregata TaxID=51156 RepID=UPI0026DBFAC8|nr:uncharacterized protein ONS95_006763 [Cadophora gregata]XP_058351724.1 uncharacterized protein ONS95_004837 [Cadophora gregata]XP_058352749.1 uncharacterized protein ONS95_004650 [Cadophora gregata]XP_058354060.1 uncharacterized protein ONS95_003495 [Cadophora gregata]XP_058354173.1 uncharacterized protein ONS95_002201 [Cadophora gregata]XP_058355646.1 uncharacterized protein ONS95_002097 [Cadophora gregata]XP_058357929.1 uncharacterized protein ONS95_013546 [Cadophora gregata]XP_05835995
MSSKTTKYKQRIALAETINSYGSPSMPCSNCIRYHRNCVVLNEKSQRCGECVRRGVKCDALQVSIDDLQSLRMEEDRLKFERDMAFEAAMAGLARVRELEQRQAELRERGREMLRRGLRTLDELDEAEAKERVEKAEAREAAEREKQASAARPPTPPPAGDSSEFHLVDEPLPDFGNSFWEDLGFVDGNFAATQGSGG